MTDNDKKYGRTFFDFIAEHPKWTFFSFLLLLLISVCLAIFGVPFKVGNVEVGDRKTVLHDTIIKSKTDTQFIDKSPIIIKSTPIIRQPKSIEKSVSVKSNDTIITVQNQPANINTGTNNGIIGNNNDVKVNVNEVQRKLNDQSKQTLLQMIFQTIESKNIKDSCIEVAAIIGNKEAFNFAAEILAFLQEQKLKVSGIGQFMTATPVKGVSVGTQKHKKECVSISVGYRQ